MSIRDDIRARLLAGLDVGDRKKLDALRRSEWSKEFERLMRNRLIMGAMRYGELGNDGKPRYSRVSSMIRRLEKFRKTGNLELLVDVANLCMCEYVEGDHPKRHWDSVDDGEHVGRKS